MTNIELQDDVKNYRAKNYDRGKFTWPTEIKDKVRVCHRSGQSIDSLSKTLGISSQTIYNWVRSKKVKSPKSNFSEVKVVGEAPSSLILSWSNSLTVSGLSFEQFKELLQKGLL